ncbi:hypothetical protein GCM10018965_014650 [Nonomuraea roseola]
MSEPPSSQQPAERPSRFRRWINGLSSTAQFLVAFTAVVAAALGLWGALGFPLPEAPSAAGGASTRTAGPHSATTSGSRPTGVETASPAPATGASPQPETRNATQEGRTVTLGPGYGIHLDSLELNWGVGPAYGDNLNVDRNSVEWEGDAAPTSGGPDYNACTAVTAYSHRTARSTMSDGDEFCARTKGGRYSWVRFVRIEADPVEVSVVTWE